MAGRLDERGGYRLEGLCGGTADEACTARNYIRLGPEAEGIERLEARFVDQAFAPHRHDTYAIGITISGVQTFRYRGERRHCLPGQCHVLHPDEVHDGGPGTAEGFAYRIAYIDPSVVQDALGGCPLPFVPDPVVGECAAVDMGSLSALWNVEEPLDALQRIEAVTALADMLGRLSGRNSTAGPLRLASLQRVRDLIAADLTAPHPVEQLEALSGLDRWTLARQFRTAFGTSPSNFRTMRRLDLVRRLIRDGMSLVDSALEAGFCDQSHMSRMFKRTYGLTPAKWAAALA